MFARSRDTGAGVRYTPPVPHGRHLAVGFLVLVFLVPSLPAGLAEALPGLPHATSGPPLVAAPASPLPAGAVESPAALTLSAQELLPSSTATSTGAAPTPATAALVRTTEAPRTSASTTSDWYALTLATAPSPRANASIAFDPAEGYVLLFGGRGPSGLLDDTWIFQSGAWTELSPTSTPSARAGASLAYDDSDHSLVLFGGWGTGGYLADTWYWRSGNWVELHPASSPSARAEASLAYDDADANLTLFGGVGAGGYSGQTWYFRDGAWTLLAPGTSPSARAGAAMAFDATDGNLTLFGGRGSGGLLSDTWFWKAGTWTSITPSGSVPAARQGSALVYDDDLGALLLFGGNGSSGALGDSWTFQGTAWTALSPSTSPSARSAGALVYDEGDGLALLFGGWETQALGDSYVLKGLGSSPLWENVTSSPAPPSREDAMMAYDPSTGYVLLYGGYSASGCGTAMPAGYCTDTWVYVDGAWAEIHPSTTPGGLEGAAMAYDPALGVVVLFGGFVAGYGYSLATYEFADGTWTRLCTGSETGGHCVEGGNGEPSGAWGWQMVFDEHDGYLLLFGGLGPTGPNAATWAFVNTTWEPLTTSGSVPGSSAFGGLAYDDSDGLVVYFGGGGCSSVPCNGLSPSNGTWTYAANAWSLTAPARAPSARTNLSLTYDPSDGYLLLLGGCGQGCGGDTWVYEHGVWANLTSAAPLGGVFSATMAEDPPEGGVVLVDGQDVQRTYAFNTTNLFYGGTAAAVTGASVASIDANQTAVLSAVTLGATPPVNVIWTGLPGGCSSASTLDLTCTPTSWGTFWIKVTTADALGRVATSVAWPWTVLRDPTLTAIVPTAASADVGQSVSFSTTLYAAGSGGDTYAWSGFPGCASVNLLSWGPCSASAAANLTVAVTATDSNHYTATETLPFTLYRDPLLLTVRPFPSAVEAGEWVNFTAVTGGGAPPGSFAWSESPSGLGCRASTNATWSCDPTLAGSGYVVSVQWTDANDLATTVRTLSFTVLTGPTVVAPDANVTTADANQSVLFTASATGGTGAYVSYQWSGLPLADCTGTSSASLVCDLLVAGTYSVRVSVTDSTGATSPLSPALAFTVLSDPLPTTPSPTPGGSPTDSGDVNATVTFSTTASGGTGGYTYVWYGLAAGCTGTTSATVTCPLSTVGTLDVEVAARDSTGYLSVPSPPLVFQVYPDPALGALAASPSEAVVGEPVTIAVTLLRSGSGGDVFSWSGLSGGTCTGGTTATVTCTFDAVGFVNVSVVATDTNGGTSAVSTTLELQVAAFPSLGSPVANRTSVDVGRSVTFQLPVTGEIGPEMSIRWSGLPTGCLGANATAVVCTPSAAGSFEVGATLRDPEGQSSSSPLLSFVVAADPSLSGPVGVPAVVDEGSELSLQVTVIGGVAPYTFVWSGLPAGCAGSSATLTCTPTANGTFSVEVEVTDASGVAVTSGTEQLVVDPALRGYLIAPSSGSAGGTLAFSAVISGGTAPLTESWRFGDGGTASGTDVAHDFTHGGAYVVTLWVNDSGGGSLRLTSVVTIASAPSSGGTLPLEWLAGVVVAIVVLLLGVLFLRRRRSSGGAGVAEADGEGERAPAPGVGPGDLGEMRPGPSVSAEAPVPPPAPSLAAPLRVPVPSSAARKTALRDPAPAAEDRPVTRPSPLEKEEEPSPEEIAPFPEEDPPAG